MRVIKDPRLNRRRSARASRVSSLLMRWYRKHARTLPWRCTKDPYAIWIAEVMLQQTRVATVQPYYERWMAALPDLQSLSKASEQRVLRLWEGLGYYARARMLRRAARVIVAEHGSRLPQDIGELRRLPGVGRYTAGAIASIAFDARTPVLDGNVARVLCRLFDVTVPVTTGEGRRQLWALAEDCLPASHPGDHNQAMMELGAVVCRPKDPACGACPLRNLCLAARRRTQQQRPVRVRRQITPTHVYASAVIERNGRYLLAQRPTNGLLGGLWEFPQVRLNDGTTARLTGLLKGEYGLSVRRLQRLVSLSHAYSHFRVIVHTFRCELAARSVRPQLRWVRASQLDALPMGKVDRMVARRVTGRLGDR